MKPTALFTNSARGKLVDQAALVAALQENRIGGVALDVYEEEPSRLRFRCTPWPAKILIG